MSAAPALPAWRSLYLAGALLYLALNGIVSAAAGLDARRAVLLTAANTVPLIVLGIPVVRWYRSGGTASVSRHIAMALLFAIAAVSGSALMTWIGIGRRTFSIQPAAALWSIMVALLVFGILAAAARLLRMQSDLLAERERTAAAEAMRARAELSALRSRIDPHFLFNTLHSLLSLVRQDPLRAEEAIEQFSEILRYTFGAGDGSEERTLRQEWQLVENYLALERLRLGERLRVDQRLDPAAAATPLPVLTIQPLVENAIRHAIARRTDGGTIRIAAAASNGEVRIDVSDDGPGTPDRCERPGGQGLQLVRERLDRFFHGRARMDLEASPEGGLRVSIHIPLDGD
jgi:signal transduction histidine kinase